MSSTLQTFVSVLNGTNYQQWAAAIQSYLMSQGQWKVCSHPPPAKDETASTSAKLSSEKAAGKDTITDDSDNYKETLMKALGNICLCLHHTIRYQYADEESPYRLWAQLKTKYSNPGVSHVFIEFKAMMDTVIPAHQDPFPAINKILTHFIRLKEIGFKLSEKVQVMMFLVKCPSTMETIIQLFTLKQETDPNLSLEDIVKAMGASWQANTRTGNRQNNQQQANKLSVVKWGQDAPQFQQQQQNNQQQHGDGEWCG